MPPLLTTCVTACLASTLLSQQFPGSTARAARSSEITLDYPADLATAKFSPFRDSAGLPLQVVPRDSGAADLDGDGNQDLWFLADSGSSGRLVVNFPNTGSLGRYTLDADLASTPYAAAVTYRTKTSWSDFIMAVDPNSAYPYMLKWTPTIGGSDPREGSLVATQLSWHIGSGVSEIAAADHSEDGHDDIVVLQPIAGGQTAVHKIELGTAQSGFLWAEQHVYVVLPAAVENLRLLDLDGDGLTDFVVDSPGIGFAAFRDNGQGSFEPAGIWPFDMTEFRDIAVGDLDGNGCDDIALCYDPGILLIEFDTTGGLTHDFRVFFNPPGIGPLATCRILSSDDPDLAGLIAMPADGQNYVIHPRNPSVQGLVQPNIGSAPFVLSGPGLTPEGVIVADVDNDDDPDLLVQSPSRDFWFCLRSPTVSLAPTWMTSEDVGPAPLAEGAQTRNLNVTVGVPQDLISRGVLFLEAAVYVVDPTSPDPADPDYLYWGRLLPPIDFYAQSASFTVYYNENQQEFSDLVSEYKQRLIDGHSTSELTFPPFVWETIRGGPGCFISVHGSRTTKRYESANGNPNVSGSTLGGKWVLMAKPPSPKGDLNPLPWE